MRIYLLYKIYPIRISRILKKNSIRQVSGRTGLYSAAKTKNPNTLPSIRVSSLRGADRIWTGESGCCRPTPYHLATAPYSVTRICHLSDTSALICRFLRKLLHHPETANDPDGNRTRVTAVKGRCLNRLTMGPYFIVVAMTSTKLPE